MEQKKFIPNFYTTLINKDHLIVLANKTGDNNIIECIKQLIEILQKNNTLQSLDIYTRISQYLNKNDFIHKELLNILYYWTANSNGNGGFNFTQHADPSPSGGGCWKCCDKCEDCCDCCC